MKTAELQDKVKDILSAARPKNASLVPPNFDVISREIARAQGILICAIFVLIFALGLPTTRERLMFGIFSYAIFLVGAVLHDRATRGSRSKKRWKIVFSE